MTETDDWRTICLRPDQVIASSATHVCGTAIHGSPHPIAMFADTVDHQRISVASWVNACIALDARAA